jgi:hypothetical protein
MVRNPSNLVPVPAFHPLKITPDSRTALYTDLHKIKSGVRDCKYPRTEPSRGPRALGHLSQYLADRLRRVAILRWSPPAFATIVGARTSYLDHVTVSANIAGE